jgi:rhodanese-related sulfurtransferase
MILVDIRKDAAKSHIPGASAINIGNLNTVKAQFPKGKDMKRAPFIVYGKDKSDEKDAFALAYKITALGYKKVSVLNGGFAAFTKIGKAVSEKLVTTIKYVHKKMPGETSAKDFVAMIQTKIPDGVVFLDIRESSEITDDPAMTLLGAINIPLTDLETKVKTLDKTKKYYTFCSSGMRAGLARDILAKNGIKAFYVKARVEGDAETGITFDEKIKIAPAQIEKLKRAKLIVRPKKKLKKSTDDMGC